MNIDGVNTLACLCRIPKDTASASKIYPLPHSMSLTVYRDIDAGVRDRMGSEGIWSGTAG